LSKNIIGVSNNSDSPWLDTVENVVSLIDYWRISSEDEIHSELLKNKYDLILIEASSIKGSIVALVSRLKGDCSGTPIIVVTTSPTWQNARDVFIAGAADYMRSTLDEERLLTLLSNALR
jgi:DNA-binding response OmpR family regulator